MASSACAAAFSLPTLAGKPMRHPHPHLRSGIDPSSKGALNIPERIIEQYFVATDVNADRGHASKSAAERRSQWMFRVGAS